MKRPFRSFLAPLFEEFILSRQAAGQWCGTYYENLHYFDDHLARNYPDSDILTDQMTRWCNPRPTENGNSCRVRTTVVWNFVDYARKRGWTTAKTRRDGINAPCSYGYFTGDLRSIHQFIFMRIPVQVSSGHSPLKGQFLLERRLMCTQTL